MDAFECERELMDILNEGCLGYGVDADDNANAETWSSGLLLSPSVSLASSSQDPTKLDFLDESGTTSDAAPLADSMRFDDGTITDLPLKEVSVHQSMPLIGDGGVDTFFYFNSKKNLGPAQYSVPLHSFSNQPVWHDVYKPFPPQEESSSAHTYTHIYGTAHSQSALTRPVQRAGYQKVKGLSSQKCRIFPDIPPDDRSRTISQANGCNTLWFFLLGLLANPENKSIIAWTGLQRQFRIKDTKMLCQLWSAHNNRTSAIQWGTLLRTIRTCGTSGILMAVPSTKHKGRNEEGLFGFVIEPASYLKKTREELDEFIRENCENASLIQLLQSSTPSPVTDQSQVSNQGAFPQHHFNFPIPNSPHCYYNHPQTSYHIDTLAVQASTHHSNSRYQPY